MFKPTQTCAVPSLLFPAYTKAEVESVFFFNPFLKLSLPDVVLPVPDSKGVCISAHENSFCMGQTSAPWTGCVSKGVCSQGTVIFMVMW